MAKKTAPQRLIGKQPRIGIRPVIDGREHGVRESLEGQTMAMARMTAEFLSANLKHGNGESVECILPDRCIGGAAEAAQTADLFAREKVGVILTVTPCWCYGSEIMDLNTDLPQAVWGFNGTERPGAVLLAAIQAAHNQKGIPAFSIYGHDVQDRNDNTIPADVQEKLLRYARTGLAAASMRGKSYLSAGYCSMGIAGSAVQDSFMGEYLGLRTEYVDMTEFARRIDRKVYDPQEFEKAVAWAKENCRMGQDWNPKEARRSAGVLSKEWQFSLKMALIMRDLMVGNPRLKALGFGEEAQGHNAIAAGFQGQRAWTDHYPNGDVMEAILNTSFDWNGTRQPYVVATENDSLNAISMLFGNLLTNTAQIFSDVRTYWSPEAVKRVTGHTLQGRAAGGMIHLINSGPTALDGSGRCEINGQPAIKPFWDITEAEKQACLAHTSWHPAIYEYFRGGGFSTRFVTRGEMPVTMCRLNITRGLGPALQIAEGYTTEIPLEAHKVLEERTSPTWPTTWFVPRLTGSGAFTDVYEVMAHWGANHGAISYGHIGADLISLASILRIPVCMHNIESSKVFRPAAWTQFGTADAEGADYRACQTFGALYR